MWTIKVAGPAQKAVAKFPARDQQRIRAAVAAMAVDPFSGDIVKLEGGGNRWRRRLGNYRVFFNADAVKQTVDVVAITRRTSTTY